jgi:hypothetical protein
MSTDEPAAGADPGPDDDPTPAAPASAGTDDDRLWEDDSTPTSGRSFTPWIVAGGLVVVLVILFARGGSKSDDSTAKDPSATTVAGSSATTAAGDAKRYWPSAVNGRPVAFGQQLDQPPATLGDVTPGLYVWSDYDGWHLWYARAADGPELQGTLVSGGNVEKALPENAAGVELKVEGTTVTFTLGKAGQAVSGITMNPGFYSDRVKITLDGTTPIFLGRTTDPHPSPIDIVKE